MQILVPRAGCVPKSRFLWNSGRGGSSWIALAVCCLFAGAQASGQSTGSCLPWPSTAVPFDSVYYVSNTSASGDRLVVGNMSLSTYSTLRSQLPAPSFVNQEFCGSLELAPGIYAKAYVPTTSEWYGDFSTFNGILRDPYTSTQPANGAPFPGNIIPLSRIPLTFAWRIDSHNPAIFGNLDSALAFRSGNSLPYCRYP